ncbi:MAG: hypothetical protein J6W00_04235, partial [Lentisphaeria bacterium]|nr:hypothetical protein [Lentisphaeria bacterium]
LNTCWYPCEYQVLFPYGNFAPLNGQPRIESQNNLGHLFYQNATSEWNTLWLFLRMSTGVIPSPADCSNFGGATQYEYTNAITVVKQNGLSGCWGGKNRISENSKWHEDKTVLNPVFDPGWTRECITDSDGIPVHNIIFRNWNGTAVILPEMILHRPGFGSRRVFMAPENIHYPIRRGSGVSGIVNVTLSLPCENCISEDLTLCFPGGAKAVDICDLTLIRRAEKVNLRVLEKQGRSGWEFAMRFAARLRKEHIDFSVNLLTGNNCQVLNMKKFRKALVDQDLVVPAELSDDFEGNLISFLESKHPELIPGVLHKGALMLASGTFSPEVAFYLATSVRHGCWDGRWQSVKRSCKVSLFADKYSFSRLEKTKIPTGVAIRSGNITLEKAREFVRDSGLVIFASEDMHNDKTRFHALVKFCLEHDISVIVFTDNPDHFVQRIAYSHYILTSQRNGLNTEYCFGSAEIPFGVKFTLNGEWQLSSCSDMKLADIADKFKMSGESPVSNGTEDFKDCSADKIRNAMFDSDPLIF